jgi:hypothetical protein
MRRNSGLIVVAFLAAVFTMPDAPAAGQRPKVDELIALHDLGTSVSIGHYYLKQESLLSIRALLARVGRDQKLGADWNSRNVYWQQAEQAMLAAMMDRIDDDFVDLAWLRPQWIELGSNTFNDQELDTLIAHFRADIGKKQLQIIDHTVSTHVMMTLSFSGKLKILPGVEDERARMQKLWNDEDERMRFSIHDTANADGQAFALSPLGKKYVSTAILRLTGIVSRRIDNLARELPLDVEQHGEMVRPFVDGFKSASI